jgi:hypothetical protein
LAWIRATSADAKYRDGKEAVALAKKACDLTSWKDPEYINTLAAAHAEAGDFDQAVMYQRRVLLFRLEPEFFAGARQRFHLYEQKKAYHEE